MAVPGAMVLREARDPQAALAAGELTSGPFGEAVEAADAVPREVRVDRAGRAEAEDAFLSGPMRAVIQEHPLLREAEPDSRGIPEPGVPAADRPLGKPRVPWGRAVRPACLW